MRCALVPFTTHWKTLQFVTHRLTMTVNHKSSPRLAPGIIWRMKQRKREVHLTFLFFGVSWDSASGRLIPQVLHGFLNFISIASLEKLTLHIVCVWQCDLQDPHSGHAQWCCGTALMEKQKLRHPEATSEWANYFFLPGATWETWILSEGHRLLFHCKMLIPIFFFLKLNSLNVYIMYSLNIYIMGNSGV